MTSLLSYLLEANLLLVTLTCIYYLFLRNENQLEIRRWYIIMAVLVACLVPMVSITNPIAIPWVGYTDSFILLPNLTVQEQRPAFQFDPWQTIFWLYVTGVSGMLIRLVLVYFKIKILVDGAVLLRHENGFDILASPREHTFSFFNKIVVSSRLQLTEIELNQIVQHELFHSKKRHSIDILLLEIIKLIFWFNPCSYWIKKEMSDIHEFQADNAAAKHGIQEYCSLLARITIQLAGLSLVNHFNQSLTIKRIIMLKSMKKKVRVWKTVSVVFLAATAIVIAACDSESEVVQEQHQSTGSAGPKIDPQPELMKLEGSGDEQLVYKTVDKTSEYPGGLEELYKWIGEEMKYPEQARELGVEGKVFVQFVIQKDGSLSDISVLKGIGAGCDEEVIRVLSQSRKWVPAEAANQKVNQAMIMPVVFKLEM